MLTKGTLVEDRYVVLEHIGTGAFTRTYRARHAARGSLHVLQVLEPPHADADDIRERFLAEGRLRSKLAHPHLAATTDVVTTPVPAIVTAPTDGPTLRAHLTGVGGPLPPADVLALMRPVIDAVGAAHTAGLAHRALAPEHIVLTTDAAGRRHPIVTDFGVAQVLEGATPTAPLRHADAARQAAMLQYRSPEQLRGDAAIGPETDLYALGVLLYEQLTGQLPFESDSAFDTRRDILAGTYWPPEMLVPDLSPALGLLLRRALALAPEDRFPDCASLAAALVEAAAAAPPEVAAAPTEGVAADAPPPEPPTDEVSTNPGVRLARPTVPVAPPPPAPAACARAPLALLAVGALVLVVAALVYARRSSPVATAPAQAVASGSANAAAPLPSFAERYPLVPLAPRRFTMGAPPSEPGRWKDEIEHPVDLTRPLLVGAREVDQALWTAVMGTNPSRHVAPDHPVENITWREAVAFCNALSVREGLVPAYVVGADVTWRPDADGFRLPTEAEWEAAARADATTPFAGSATAADVAWYEPNAGGATHPVGALAPNTLGLFDMSGNVSEWAWDWYGAYPTELAVDPTGPGGGESRIHRGGSWDADERAQRVAYRRAALPGTRSASIGLRVVRTVGPARK